VLADDVDATGCHGDGLGRIAEGLDKEGGGAFLEAFAGAGDGSPRTRG
jgi:hypothetical protein